MAKTCPLTNGKVLYVECLECAVRKECDLGLLDSLNNELEVSNGDDKAEV